MTDEPKYRAMFERWSFESMERKNLMCSAYKDGVRMKNVVNAYDVGDYLDPCDMLDRIYYRIQSAIKRCHK